MKAAHHGSPPLARSNRHSNRSINHLTPKSRSNPYNQTMPPFLRLDSTGEVTAYDRPQKNLGHIKTNTCRQGPENSAGSSHGRNRPSFFGKLFSHLAPQPSTSSALLDSSKTQDGINLDELLLHSKPGFSSVPMAEKPTHVKMAQINVHVPHVNRYGHWRIMSHVHPSYPVLPRGVFPCHVIQAQREPQSMWPTSGHFVVKNGMSALTCCSLLDAFKCSPDSSNSSQKTESDSDSSISIENTVRSCDKVSSTQNRTTACGDFVWSSENMKMCLSKKSDPFTGNSMATCRPVSSRDTVPSSSTTSSTDEISNHCDTVCCMKCLTDTTSRRNCQSQTSGESSDFVDEKENVQPQRNGDQSSTTQTPSQPQIIDDMSSTTTEEQEEDRVKAISSQTEALRPSTSLEEDWNDDDNSDWEGCHDNVVADGEEENEEEWDCFLGSQFCLSNFMSRPSRRQPLSCEEEEFRLGERRVSKPCPGLTAKWLRIYSDTASSQRSPFKVRFECGEGKDTVHEFVKGDDETLTVMELQKARDQIKQHGQNAAKLLQQQQSADSDDDDDDDTSGEGGSDTGAVGGAKAAPKKKCPRACAGNTSRVPAVPVRKDNSSQNTDSKEEDEQDKDCGKIDDDEDDDNDSVVFENDDDDNDSVVFENDGDDDDDSVVFKNDDDDNDSVVFENEGVEQSGVDKEEGEESDSGDEDEEPCSSEEEEEEDEDSDIDIVFECDSDKKKKQKEHSHG